jgi:hypothetical protein
LAFYARRGKIRQDNTGAARKSMHKSVRIVMLALDGMNGSQP